MTSSPGKSSVSAGSSPLRNSPVKKSPSKNSPTKQAANSANRPSAEDLVDLERELNRLIARKTAAEASLVTLEGRLYDLETEYLTETAPFGNLIHGLEGYLGLSVGSGNTTTTTNNAVSTSANNRRSAFASGAASIASMATNGIPLSQRLFSATSTTFPESLALLGRKEEAAAAGYVAETESANTKNASNSNHHKQSSNGLKKIPGLVKASDSKAGSGNSNNNKKKKTASSHVNANKKSEPTWTPPPMKARKK